MIKNPDALYRLAGTRRNTVNSTRFCFFLPPLHLAQHKKGPDEGWIPCYQFIRHHLTATITSALIGSTVAHRFSFSSSTPWLCPPPALNIWLLIRSSQTTWTFVEPKGRCARSRLAKIMRWCACAHVSPSGPVATPTPPREMLACLRPRAAQGPSRGRLQSPFYFIDSFMPSLTPRSS